LSTWNQGSAVPGFAAIPNAWLSPNTPCGVRIDPSCACPTPAAPTYAWMGPATRRWAPVDVSSQPSTVAVVAVPPAAFTVTTCPGVARQNASKSAGSATAGA
jgi:hypothetical protein